MRVSAAETPKYATKQIRSEDTIPMGMALWGFFTSSPGGTQKRVFRGKKCSGTTASQSEYSSTENPVKKV